MDVNCPVCHDLLTPINYPITGRCGHSICLRCFNNKIYDPFLLNGKKEWVPCPLERCEWRESFWRLDFEKNKVFTRILGGLIDLEHQTGTKVKEMVTELQASKNETKKLREETASEIAKLKVQLKYQKQENIHLRQDLKSKKLALDTKTKQLQNYRRRSLRRRAKHGGTDSVSSSSSDSQDTVYSQNLILGDDVGLLMPAQVHCDNSSTSSGCDSVLEMRSKVEDMEAEMMNEHEED